MVSLFVDDMVIYKKIPRNLQKLPRSNKQTQQGHRIKINTEKQQLYFQIIAMKNWKLQF